MRFLLRHCPSLAYARDSNGEILYDRLPADDDNFVYARRLVAVSWCAAEVELRRSQDLRRSRVSSPASATQRGLKNRQIHRLNN